MMVYAKDCVDLLFKDKCTFFSCALIEFVTSDMVTMSPITVVLCVLTGNIGVIPDYFGSIKAIPPLVSSNFAGSSTSVRFSSFGVHNSIVIVFSLMVS